MGLMVLMLTGCKPYDEPEYISVDTSETAYLIPLEQNSESKKLESPGAYDDLRVSSRRVQIPHRWNKTGRAPWTGQWIGTVRLVTVNRTTVTEEWRSGENDQAIWVESADSIGFSIGFNCSANISEPNASTFLYNYPASPTSEGTSRLRIVMESEIRNKIQEVAADFAAEYTLDLLRAQKNEMISRIRNEVIPFFEEKGISITTIGMFDGFTYENAQIQTSIDNVFVAQQEKNKEAALLEAMEDKQERLRLEGAAIANQNREEAQGEADAVLIRAQAEADSITLVNEATLAAQDNVLFLQVKMLEVELERIRTWDGSVPNMMFGGDNGAFLPMIQIPNE